MKKQGIPVNPHLPAIESDDEVKIKSPEEIMQRALCAFLTAQIGCDVSQGNDLVDSANFFGEILKKFGLENNLTADEKRLFEYDESDEIDDDFILNITWRLEMCMPLFWACGFVNEDAVSLSDINDTTFIIPTIMECEDFSDIINKVKIKSKSEILDKADVIYRMDWACVDARVKGISAPSELNSEVVYEQHKGFNWIIGADGSDDWDNVSADT